MADAPRPLADALTDLFWKATPYGETEDGDIAAYLLPKGVMHRLLHQAREAGVTSAAFRSMAERAAPTEASTPLPGLQPCPKCGADGWSYCRDRKGEPLPLDRSHVDRRIS